MQNLLPSYEKHNSFEAEEGCNDDLAMCLVIFSWLVHARVFQRDLQIRISERECMMIKEIRSKQDMAPFGFIV